VDESDLLRVFVSFIFMSAHDKRDGRSHRLDDSEFTLHRAASRFIDSLCIFVLALLLSAVDNKAILADARCCRGQCECEKRRFGLHTYRLLLREAAGDDLAGLSRDSGSGLAAGRLGLSCSEVFSNAASKHSPRNVSNSADDSNFSSLPVSTSSMEPWKCPVDGLVSRPNRTTNAPRIVPRVRIPGKENVT